MSNAFEWHHELHIDTPIVGTRKELGIRLIAKVPMAQMVVDSDGWVYSYHPINNGIRYIRLYTAFKEKENE